MKMASGLTHIRRVTTSTLKRINNTRPQELGDLVLERKEGGNTCRMTENKPNGYVREGSVAEAVKLRP